MKLFYEGQTINLENEFKELSEGKDQLTYDFVEIKDNSTRILFKTPFYQIPCTDQIDDKGSYFLALRFYSIGSLERNGILKYKELDSFEPETVKCLKTVVFTIEKPCYHQEFFKGDAKYIALKPKLESEFKLFASKGELIKEGPFYKVFGNGPYVYNTNNILYSFK